MIPVRNQMGLMTGTSPNITDRVGEWIGMVRFIFVPGKFAPILAGVNVRGKKYDVVLSEYIDGKSETFKVEHVHYFRDGIVTIIAGIGQTLFYGHGFKHKVKRNKEHTTQRTNECIVQVLDVVATPCISNSVCSSFEAMVMKHTLNLKTLVVTSTIEASDEYNSNSVEENTFSFLNPQPNCAFEVDYAFREWRWVLTSKEYLDVCVKRKAENGLHFLSMALHAQEAKESETP